MQVPCACCMVHGAWCMGMGMNLVMLYVGMCMCRRLCMYTQGVPPGALRRVILTASGGAFRDFSADELLQLNREQAR